jgi:hypothetical protein
LRTALLSCQQQIHREAAADVGAGAAEVFEDGLLGAAGLFQRVCQDSETLSFEVTAGKPALVICTPGESANQGRYPLSVERNAMPGIAKEVAE